VWVGLRLQIGHLDVSLGSRDKFSVPWVGVMAGISRLTQCSQFPTLHSLAQSGGVRLRWDPNKLGLSPSLVSQKRISGDLAKLALYTEISRNDSERLSSIRLVNPPRAPPRHENSYYENIIYLFPMNSHQSAIRTSCHVDLTVRPRWRNTSPASSAVTRGRSLRETRFVAMKNPLRNFIFS